eukprot:jgi/Phyca11/15090/fgenesh1_pg.PHYCAscaffold_11_\
MKAVRAAVSQLLTTTRSKLYSLVKQYANVDEHTLLYDGVGKVVGIKVCKPATDDAEVNAALNKVKDVTFVNSKATDAMEDLLRKKREENEKHLNRVVAIVGPRRAGLHHLGFPRPAEIQCWQVSWQVQCLSCLEALLGFDQQFHDTCFVVAHRWKRESSSELWLGNTRLPTQRSVRRIDEKELCYTYTHLHLLNARKRR